MTAAIDTFLLVENNDLDAERLFQALCRVGDSRRILRARDGAEALEIIRGSSEVGALRRPYIVLLDLMSSRLGEHDLLTELCFDPAHRDTPIVLLATSAQQLEIQDDMPPYVSAYLQKPDSIDGAARMLDVFCAIWSLAMPSTVREG